jgi:hypothetical protein
MLGIHITVTVAWRRTSAGDWTAYRRNQPHDLQLSYR